MIKSELHQNGANSKLSPKFGFEITKNVNDWRDFNPKKAWAHYLQEIESQFFLYVNRGIQQSFMSSGSCLHENVSILLVFLQDLTASPDSIQVPLLLPEVFTQVG